MLSFFGRAVLLKRTFDSGILLRFVSGSVKKRFRLTANGKIKRKPANSHHNTGLKRPRVAHRKRKIHRLEATPKIRNTIRKILLGG